MHGLRMNPSGNRLGILGCVLMCSLISAVAAETNAVVVALGKLRPREGLVRVAAPFSMQGPSLMAELLVTAGAQVTEGQVLGRTHMHAAAAAAVAQAAAEVAVREARLGVVEAGLKPSEIAALAAEAERERAEFGEASLQWRRAQRLREDHTIAPQEWENAEARWRSASNRVAAAVQRLAAGSEVRAVDLALARAEVQAAKALEARARREFEQTEVRAPFAGEVIAVHAKPGEVAAAGVLDLGRTHEMEVVAEVYESDLRRVGLRRSAEVRGDAFEGGLRAEVVEIGRQVRPNRLLNPDPAAFADNRVVEVILRLADSAAVRGLSGALVNVRFDAVP